MTTTQPAFVKPTLDGQRIEYLDILRGIAILCIYVANIGFFSGDWFFSKEDRIPSTLLPTDGWLDFLCYTFIDGKFYTVFSLLFGIGCIIQYNSLKLKKISFNSFFLKRMFWLLVFGLIHLIVFWAGDILTLYALLGFTLIWFVEWSNKKLLLWGIILQFIPIFNWVIIHYWGLNYPDVFRSAIVQYWEYFGFPTIMQQEVKYPNLQYIFLNESWRDFFVMNPGNALFRIFLILEEGRIFKVLGIFLIGLWSGRQILHNNLLDNKILLKKIVWWGIGIGLPFSLFRTYIEFYLKGSAEIWAFIHTISYAIGTVPLAVGISALIALNIRPQMQILKWFSPVGKMAFSNYIFQTLISICIFYGVGFQWAGKLGYTYIILICLLVFTLQILISTWWLKRFRFGPLEWLWRSCTYWRIQPFKRW
ncbi:MAG: DUF418 domain-containing protein [Saprospiraceae bacterium]